MLIKMVMEVLSVESVILQSKVDIDSARFMAGSLANFADNLAEQIQKISVKIAIVFLNMKVSRII